MNSACEVRRSDVVAWVDLSDFMLFALPWAFATSQRSPSPSHTISILLKKRLEFSAPFFTVPH
jgi:hypothetical protein